MVTRRSLVLSLVGMTLLSRVGTSQERPSFKTIDDIDAFTKTYYQHPRPELIASLMESVHSSGLTEKPTAAPPFIAFFSEVFAANPGRVPEWQAVIAKQDESARKILEPALALSKRGGVMAIHGRSAPLNDIDDMHWRTSLNDMYWGAFVASGRVAFLQKLVDQLRYYDERDDEALFLAGGTAKWSLASVAQSDTLVRSTLEGRTLTADPRTRTLITELLSQGPVRVKQDLTDVIRTQREAGKWP